MQVGFHALQLVKFCLSQVFGFEFQPHRASLNARRGVGGDGDEIVVIDEGDIDRQLGKYRELGRGGDNYLI